MRVDRCETNSEEEEEEASLILSSRLVASADFRILVAVVGMQNT
jgi:hypothetical protein